MKNNLKLFRLTVLGLAIVTGASAQPVITTNAPALTPPASNRIALSTVSGKARVLDSKGLILESNLVYLPRINISDLSDTDLRSLLETRTAYAALTSFGPSSERTAQSAVIEKQLQQIWLQGHSLADKIQTRLDLLDEMRAYNANLSYLPGLMVKAGDEAARAAAVDRGQAFKSQAAANAANGLDSAEDARAEGAASRQQVHEAWADYEAANERAARADNRAIAANDQSAIANQSLTNYLNACAAISTNLASYGISIPAAPPFYRVPPLVMRAEVDAQRAADKPSTAGQ